MRKIDEPDTRHQTSTLVDIQHNVRVSSAESFDVATKPMIVNFDTALTAFETEVHEGRANVHVASRNGSAGGGGGSTTAGDVTMLLALVVMCRSKKRRIS